VLGSGGHFGSAGGVVGGGLDGALRSGTPECAQERRFGEESMRHVDVVVLVVVRSWLTPER
jgi:hypothetical protein